MELYRGVVNTTEPILKAELTDEVDKVMIEMGLPVISTTLDWTFDDLQKEDSITYAPVDEDTR